MRTPASQETASGELYDAEGWTAAIRIDLRDRFGGVHYGKNYQPAYALVEAGNKRAIIKVNDVGPLMPGRIIDLNQRAMRYFDPTLQLGLVHDMRVTPLPGPYWTAGPIGGDGETMQHGGWLRPVAAQLAPDFLGHLDDHLQLRPLLVLGQDIAFLGGGEAALRRQAKLIEGDDISPPRRCGA